MTRIWLNHWFSTAYSIIGLIKENEPDFRIIGSNQKELSPIKAVCNEWYIEPALKGKEYVDFCLEFCKKHSIDVFLPHREMLAISEYKSEFAKAGVKVMAEDFEVMSLLNDKDKAYRAFGEANIGIVPEYYAVTTPQQFSEAYKTLSEKYEQICFKFIRDEGGKSYRLIDNQPKGYESLFKKQTTHISFEDAMKALSEREEFSPVMIMPYLPDEEISVDCLKTASGLIAVPRVKVPSRIESIHYDSYILDTCEKLVEKFALEMPCNIQFKYLKGVPYLLEINTRMSGGVQMSCLASGINIPNIAVNKLLGIEKPWTNNKKECSVTHAETPIIL